MIRNAFIGLILLAPTAAHADSWRAAPSESHLAFTFTQAGTPFTGRFDRFDAWVEYDPNQLDTSHIRAEIDLTSAETGAADRDTALRGPTWFDTGAYPKAVFEATGFTPREGGRFETHGTLTLKGISQPVTLQFTLETKGDLAHATGKAEIVRTNFNVGSGDFESGKWISKTVTVDLALTAERVEATP